MKYIQGTNRHQLLLFPESLDSAISEDNEVRLIDLFVDALQLEKFGFKVDFKEEGRPAYHPSDLLKLFIYGYLNKIRSSRDLEKECKRNIEVIWLMRSLQPDHNTISNFRRDNPKALKKVFRATVSIAKHFDLIGGTLIAGDSTKIQYFSAFLKIVSKSFHILVFITYFCTNYSRLLDELRFGAMLKKSYTT